MKLALAIGDNRHYAVDDIVPRHFVQTAKSNGVSESVVQGIFSELLEIEEVAIGKVMASLSESFPVELARSVIDGLRRRLGLVRHMIG